MMDLSIVMQLNGQTQTALDLQAFALECQQTYCLSSNPANADLKLLAIVGPGEIMSNAPIEFLLEKANISLDFLFVGADVPVPDAIPDHDLAIVAICESDENQLTLAMLDSLMDDWPRPYINSPTSIARLTRDQIGRMFQHSPHLLANQAQRMTRQRVLSKISSRDFEFPMVVRPVGSHAGKSFCKLDKPEELTSFVAQQPGDEFFLSSFIDYRSADGLYRKYRIIVIDGQTRSNGRTWTISPNCSMRSTLLTRSMPGHAEQCRQSEEAEFMKNFESRSGSTS